MKQNRLFPITIYCMDSDVLINLKHYPRDIFAPLWNKIENMITSGEIISHEEVFKEIKMGEDEIYQWCKENKYMFKETDECQINKIPEIQKKYTKDYWARKINGPNPWADPWLIALAICEKALIVTNEKNTPNRIPAIANHFNIHNLTLYDFFRKVGIKWEG